MDTTIAGSRNALTPLVLWSALQRWGEAGFRQRALACLDVAEHAVTSFQAAGVPAWRHRNSITVVFPRPAREVIQHWQMAPKGDIAHLITMPHVTREAIDTLIADVIRKPHA